jgi:predicted secreted protein
MESVKAPPEVRSAATLESAAGLPDCACVGQQHSSLSTAAGAHQVRPLYSSLIALLAPVLACIHICSSACSAGSLAAWRVETFAVS